LYWKTQVARPGDVGEDFSIGGFIGSPAAWHGRVFGATAIGGPPYYHALDGRDGDVEWSGASAPSYAASAVARGVAIAGSLDGLLNAFDSSNGAPLWSFPLSGPVSSGAAIVGDSVFVGAGTSSSDACAKGVPLFSPLCAAAFDEVLGATGAVYAFRLAGS
jgi:outer membrane protein assembly factor BamB